MISFKHGDRHHDTSRPELRIEPAGEAEAEQRSGAVRDQPLGRGFGARGRTATNCNFAKVAGDARLGGHSDNDPQGHAAEYALTLATEAMMRELENTWPALPLHAWGDSCETLHRWTQVVGKVRLALAPRINHWWQVPLYVTARGLTTSPIPHRTCSFQVDFDFTDHRLIITTSAGATETFPLRKQSVADFHRAFMAALNALGIEVRIWTTPVEIADPIPFEQDQAHASYDPEYVRRFWQILVQVDRVFTEFRARFIGKASPVHFFWGSFDHVVTRFSGRAAPPNPKADAVTREAYSHEVSSCGFWPGGEGVEAPAFYCYAFPEPAGFSDARVRPDAAFYHRDLGQFILPYEAVRTAAAPDATLLEFLQSTYEAAAHLAKWDRASLERP
jgi:Family of unknown function (DUF5996)